MYNIKRIHSLWGSSDSGYSECEYENYDEDCYEDTRAFKRQCVRVPQQESIQIKISSDLKFYQSSLNAQLVQCHRKQADSQVLAHLSRIDPLLGHLMKVKLVRHENANLVNIRVKPEFLATIHHFKGKSGLHIFVSLCDKIQPYVEILPVCEIEGRLEKRYQFTPAVWTDIAEAIREFKTRFKITCEVYRSTMLKEKEETSVKDYNHLEDIISALRVEVFGDGFRLAMRIATVMCHDKLSIFKCLFSAMKFRKIISSATRGDRNQLKRVDPVMENLIYDDTGPMRLKACYLMTVFASKKAETCFCIQLSDKLEPFVIIAGLNQNGLCLENLTRRQLKDLDVVIKEFMARYKIPPAGFLYTSFEKRKEADRLVSQGSVPIWSKAHSTAFHLKMRVPNDFYRAYFPILGSFDLERMMHLDPVSYNYTRETHSWEDVYGIMLRDAEHCAEAEQ